MIMDPSKARVRWSLPILKVPAGARMTALLGGDRWWYFGSHWIDKLYLCAGDGCEGCVYGSPRLMGYRVGVVETPTRRQPILLEAPLTSIVRFENLCELEGFEPKRGTRLSLTRRHRRSGVCLEPELVGSCAEALALDDRHTLQAVAIVFALPSLMEDEGPTQWANRVMEMARARLAAAVAKAR